MPSLLPVQVFQVTAGQRALHEHGRVLAQNPVALVEQCLRLCVVAATRERGTLRALSDRCQRVSRRQGRRKKLTRLAGESLGICEMAGRDLQYCNVRQARRDVRVRLVEQASPHLERSPQITIGDSVVAGQRPEESKTGHDPRNVGMIAREQPLVDAQRLLQGRKRQPRVTLLLLDVRERAERERVVRMQLTEQLALHRQCLAVGRLGPGEIALVTQDPGEAAKPGGNIGMLLAVHAAPDR